MKTCSYSEPKTSSHTHTGRKERGGGGEERIENKPKKKQTLIWHFILAPQHLTLPEPSTPLETTPTWLHLVQIREAPHDSLGLGVVGLYVQCQVRGGRGWVVHHGPLRVKHYRLAVCQRQAHIPRRLFKARLVLILQDIWNTCHTTVYRITCAHHIVYSVICAHMQQPYKDNEWVSACVKLRPRLRQTSPQANTSSHKLATGKHQFPQSTEPLKKNNQLKKENH